MSALPVSSISPTSGVHAALDELARLDPGGLSAAGQAEMLVELKRIESRVCAYRLQVLAAAQRSKTAARSGDSDTASWAAKHTREDGRDASRDTRLAAGLKNQSRTEQALNEGDISQDHAEVIVNTGQALPDELTPAQRDKVEEDLVEKAKRLSPSALRRRARRALEAIEAEREAVDAHEEGQVGDEEERARARTRLTLRDNHDGTVTGHFTVPVFHGHLLRKLIQTMTAPRRTNNTSSSGNGPGSGAGQASFSDHSGGIGGGGAAFGAEAGAGAGARGAKTGAGVAGAGAAGAAGAGTDAGEEADADRSGTAGHGGLSGLPDPGRVARGWQADWANAHGLALCELIEHLPTDHLSPRTAATIVVTVDEDVLRGRLAVAGLDTGEKISAAQVRQLACNSGLVPVVLGGKSVPLDLGRGARIFSEAQRTALATQHTSCAAHGCGRPFAWCELHHLVPWAEGGRTDLDQAIPLCHRHHRLIHDPKYQHTRLPDGAFTFAMRQ